VGEFPLSSPVSGGESGSSSQLEIPRDRYSVPKI
jgi:hypothetical protein